MGLWPIFMYLTPELCLKSQLFTPSVSAPHSPALPLCVCEVGYRQSMGLPTFHHSTGWGPQWLTSRCLLSSHPSPELPGDRL